MRRDVVVNMGNMSIYRNSGFNGDGVINEIDAPPQLAGGGGNVVMFRTAGPGGAMASGFAGGAADKRFRVDFYLSAQNILNRTNYTSYSGVTDVAAVRPADRAGTPRRVQLGARFSF